MFTRKGWAPGQDVHLGDLCEKCREPYSVHHSLTLGCPTAKRDEPAPADEGFKPGPLGFYPDKQSALNTQVGGSHYKNRAIQPIEYCHKNQLGPCESAIVKYVTRWREKGGLQDLEKIKHYVDMLIELEGLEK